MGIEKTIFGYYEEEINRIAIPKPVIPKNSYRKSRERIYNLVFAAVIVLASISMAAGIRTPSTLSGRTTESYVYHNLDTIIPAGLVEINKFVSESLISGGK